MTSDLESPHGQFSEQSPLIAEPREYDSDDAAPTTLSRKRTVAVTIVVTCLLFIQLGLLITASARTVSDFIIGRILAGSGAAGIYSTQAIIVLELCSKKRRGLFLGCLYTIITTGVAAGAILAGALTPKYGWEQRLIYYIQSPICLVITPILYFSIPPTGGEKVAGHEGNTFFRKLARIDYLGILTLTSANLTLLYSLSSSTIPFSFLAASLLLFVIFLIVESSPKFTTEPIVPVTILRSRGVLLSGISSGGLMMARWAVLFYLPVYGIAVRGWSPAQGGIIMIPTNAGFALGGLIVGWIHIRKARSYYTSTLIVSVFFGLSLLLIAMISTPNSSIVLYAFAIFVNGFTSAAYLNYMVSHLLHITSPSSHYIVTGLLATFRSLSGSFGSAIGGGIFSRVLKARLEAGFYDGGYHDHDDGRQELIRKLLGSPALVWQLEGYERETAITAYQNSLRMMFLVAVALTVLMTFVQAGTGSSAPVDSAKSDDGLESEVNQGTGNET
ncbi:hypothetical protein UA08_06804 [Talaromyces atroroseus]|uniref:Major facilitator superfamily (MFS) profile domain-containing protein n=1 Tax=Talaromyces atroroseus TaxID=1441469 RepID=A0A225AI39_TALAT|nr:hypothetical protein UA08_06804 [Talaromyces atroroseus]OKL57884.1 hypothetical protein UA08_06804 [Talaromyces atroroseus]